MKVTGVPTPADVSEFPGHFIMSVGKQPNARPLSSTGLPSFLLNRPGPEPTDMIFENILTFWRFPE